MTLKSILVRAATAVALSGLMAGAAAAGETGDVTVIKLKNKDQATETLRFEGELAVGESRGMYTDAGTAITVRRNDKGLSIELPDRSVEVPYGPHDGDALHAHAGASGKHKVVMIRHGEHEGAEGAEHPEHRKRIIMLKDGDGSGADIEAALAADPDLAALKQLDVDADVDVDAEGGEKVVVIRRIHKEESAVD